MIQLKPKALLSWNHVPLYLLIAIALVWATGTGQPAMDSDSSFRVSLYKDSNMDKLSHPRLWIVTGGQTGVDRAALDTALSLFLPVRGWCPKGRLAEDGTIPPVYPLQETTSTDYAVRTEWNVQDSDGTLILVYGQLEGGTKLTADLAHKYDRPVLVIDTRSFSKNDVGRFWNWIQQHHIRILNVAGPRESAQPGVIYRCARNILKQLLESSEVR